MRKTTNDSFVRGILPCLGATLLSGLAGALSQKGLQLTGGGHGRDAFLYTMEVSFYSAVTLFVSILCSSRDGRNYSLNNTTTTITTAKKQQLSQAAQPTTDWFHGWTWQTWIPILIKAYGGVLTALVHKYAGSVAKGFALMFGLVLSQLVSSMIQEQDVTMPQLVGTMLVMLSGWMHFTNPPL
jgi:UDP-sugar transporter A1/2/3